MRRGLDWLASEPTFGIHFLGVFVLVFVTGDASNCRQRDGVMKILRSKYALRIFLGLYFVTG